MTGDVRVGISGWRYANWRGDFYPIGLAQRLELAYVAERMNSVELNGSFYSLQRPESYRRWRDVVPDDFVFAVKGSRHITHMLRLRDVDTALANFLASGVLALGPKLGPILWQLPERQAFDSEALDAFLRLLPRTTGEALERAAARQAPRGPGVARDRGGRADPSRPRAALPHLRRIRRCPICCAGTASRSPWPTPRGCGRRSAR